MARFSAPSWYGVLVGLAVLACKGPPPDQLRLELPELVTLPDPVKATVHVRRGNASSVASEKVELSVVPPDVASVTQAGHLVCLKAGDAKVTASIQGVRDDEALRCRLVDRLEFGALQPFDLEKPPVTLSVRALAKSGAELNDVPVVLSTDSPRVLAVSGSTLTPKAVGNTNLTLAAGAKKQTVPVRVVRGVTEAPMAIEGGRRVYFSLPEGKFELALALPLEKKVKIEWRGAPYCTYEGSGRSHRSTCVLQKKGGVVVDNPAYLLTGATEPSATGVSVREIP
jgi:hypothetical protein